MTQGNANISATDTVTKPIYATVGAGDALYNAVNEIVDRVRDRATGDVNSRVDEARERLSTLPADMQDQVETLRGRLTGLPSELPEDLAELRDRFTSEELRKLVDQYYRQLVDLYADLAVRGEETVDRLRTNPGFDERFDKAEGLYKDLYSDVVTRAEDVLNKVSGQARGLLGKDSDEPTAVVEAEVVAVTTESAVADPAPEPVAEPVVRPVATPPVAETPAAEPSAAKVNEAQKAPKAEPAPAKKAQVKKSPAKPASAKKTTPGKK